MNLTISKLIVGTDRHLVFDGKSWSWSSNPPEGSLLWGFDAPRDLRDAARALGLEIPSFYESPWGKSQSILYDCSVSSPKWSMCVPRRDWKKISTSITEQLWMNFTGEDNSYYITTHTRNREVIYSLQRPLVDTHELSRKIKELKSSASPALKKFLPNSGDVCPKFKYLLGKSITGRMTIADGPNILTMKKSDRTIFKSRYPGGKIIEIDVVSAEPRVALSLFRKSVKGDVYSSVVNHGNLDIDRDTAKIATLSALYGASHHTLMSKVSDRSSAFKILSLVREYFGVDYIEKMISEQYNLLGYIKNTHGRKIFSKEPSLNHFIQSSTVDVAFDIFESLLGRVESERVQAVPIFLIHDAIVFDVNPSAVKSLLEICKEGFRSPVTNTDFPVRAKIL